MSDFSVRPSDSTSPPRKNSAQNGDVEVKPKASTVEELAPDAPPTVKVEKNPTEDPPESITAAVPDVVADGGAETASSAD